MERERENERGRNVKESETKQIRVPGFKHVQQ